MGGGGGLFVFVSKCGFFFDKCIFSWSRIRLGWQEKALSDTPFSIYLIYLLCFGWTFSVCTLLYVRHLCISIKLKC